MPEQTSANPPFPSVPAFWPMAMATALFEQGSELYARNIKFVDEEIRLHDHLRPKLATPNRVRLDLLTMVLRDYGQPGEGCPTLVNAPYAGHTAIIADYHRGQSLIETLMANGIVHVALTDWKSATDQAHGPCVSTVLLRGVGGAWRRPDEGEIHAAGLEEHAPGAALY
jgi:hypothetical protein